MTLVLILSALIGILLGMLGGGGSILMVPMLVYVAGLPAKQAVVTSLVVVAITSLSGLIPHAMQHRFCWKNALFFGLSGMLGAHGGGRVAGLLSGEILLILFALMMLTTATLMLVPGRKQSETPPAPGVSLCPRRVPVLAILFDGLFIGFITGLIGAGGGFMIVPALHILGHLPMQAAIGTSLGIISLNSMAALSGYITHMELPVTLVTCITLACVAGNQLGARMQGMFAPATLRQCFAWMTLVLACFQIYKSFSPAIIMEIEALFEQYREFLYGAGSVVLALAVLGFRSWLQARESAGYHEASHTGIH